MKNEQFVKHFLIVNEGTEGHSAKSEGPITSRPSLRVSGGGGRGGGRVRGVGSGVAIHSNSGMRTPKEGGGLLKWEDFGTPVFDQRPGPIACYQGSRGHPSPPGARLMRV